ncbi:MAG: PorT family protein [Saprospiraceae bacterium]|nr:PorT family protein [Saprospiraceae bacterium]
MKNLQSLFILLIVFFSLGTVFGQNTSIGLRAGASYFTIDNDLIDEDANYTMGLNLAIPFEYSLSSIFSLQPELNFTQKGIEFDGTQDGEDLYIKLRTNYVELPVLFKARYGNDFIKGYAFVGPSIGFAANRFISTKIGDGDCETESIDFITEGDVQDQRWEVSAIGGVGIDIAAGPGAFVVDVRYALGLTDDSKFDGDKPTDWKKSLNKGCTLSVGYKIPLGK